MLFNLVKKNILKSVCLIFSFILFNISAMAQGDIQASSEPSDLSLICEHSLGSKESFLQKMNPEKENIINVNTVKTKLIVKKIDTDKNKNKINTPPKSLYFASSEEIRAYENKIKQEKIQAEKLKAQELAQRQAQEKEQILILASQNQAYQNKVDGCLQS